MMLYARKSLNYLLTIKFLRRAGLLAAWPARSLVTRVVSEATYVTPSARVSPAI